MTRHATPHPRSRDSLIGRRGAAALLLLVLVSSACSDDGAAVDAAPPDLAVDSQTLDAAPPDAAPPDAPAADLAPPDLAKPDQPLPPDMQPLDQAPPDLQPLDQAPPDLPPPDLPPPDMAPPDMQPLDQAPPDLPPPDLPPPDMAPPDMAPPDIPPPDMPPPDAALASCPAEMVPLNATVCIDRYEASRSDASSSSQGSAGGASSSVAGVMPWTNLTWSAAQAACTAAGKRLCTETEWVAACRGASSWIYPYGNLFDGQACVGKDNSTLGNAPQPTGSAPGCEGALSGLFDMSGNVEEWTATSCGGTTCYRIKGGHYTSPSSALNCIYAVNSAPTTSRGWRSFRCCLTVP